MATDEFYPSVPAESKFKIIGQVLQQPDIDIDDEKPDIIRIDGLRLEHPPRLGIGESVQYICCANTEI